MRCCKPDYPRTYANHSHFLMPRATSESSLQMSWTVEEPYPEIHRYHTSRGFNDTACFLYCVCPTPLPLTPSRLPCQFYPHVVGLQVSDGQPGWLTCPFLLSSWLLHLGPPYCRLGPTFPLVKSQVVCFSGSSEMVCNGGVPVPCLQTLPPSNLLLMVQLPNLQTSMMRFPLRACTLFCPGFV
jgi:hypothetical protein